MCGIIGYIGEGKANEILLKGIKNLTYRGYDSWGLALKFGNKILIKKEVGDVSEIKNVFKAKTAKIGIAHTRWATHGKVSRANAHPHLSCDKSIAVVHNGIIDNFLELKEKLIKKGHKFVSQTDTEVIPHLIEEFSKKFEYEKAFFKALKKLKGSFAIVASNKNEDILIGARKDSPLIVGIGQGYFLASDVLAFSDFANKAIYLDDFEVAILRKGKIEIKNFEGKTVNKKILKIDKVLKSSKANFKHFMLKEILEQPTALKRALIQNKKNLLTIAKTILKAKKVIFVACGTSRHAALIGRYIFSKLAKKFCEVVLASEFEYFLPILDKKTLIIAISQSGETADVLKGVKLAKSKGAKILSIVNVMNSTLERLSDLTIGINCGPEIAVAATKSFTNQLAIFYLLGFAMIGKLNFAIKKLKEIASRIEKIFSNLKQIKNLASLIKDRKDIYFIARGINFAVALEGALKIKEISYLHAEGMPAGELKHGTLALIEKDVPVIAVCPKDSTYYDTLSNAEEAKARGAFLIGISDEANRVFDKLIRIPKVEEIFYPILTTIPLQILAYYLATLRRLNPDKPKNLAKSVTVK